MQMTMPKQQVQTLERNSYIVLLHLYTLTELAPVRCLTRDRLARDLGLEETLADQIVRSLLHTDYLEYCGSSEGLVLTPKGVRYIERGAGRRRSLRLVD